MEYELLHILRTILQLTNRLRCLRLENVQDVHTVVTLARKLMSNINPFHQSPVDLREDGEAGPLSNDDLDTGRQ